MRLTLLLGAGAALVTLLPGPAQATSFEGYVQRLAQHPQVESVLADSEALRAQAEGELGLPDPVFMMGVDNVPVSNMEFDRFLPTSKVIGISQSIPNPTARRARAQYFEQMSEKQDLVARYTNARLRSMLISKISEYKSVRTQIGLIKQQISYYVDLENAIKGQMEAGGSVYQRFSEVDVERAEAERTLNNLNARLASIEAEFIRLVGDVPAVDVPKTSDTTWDGNPGTLYPVAIAAEDIDIAEKDVGIADAAFLPNFGVDAVYKQRESGQNDSFSGDDWFSVQARMTIPLWASSSQRPKLRAAQSRARSAQFTYDDLLRQWRAHMIALQSARDAEARNVNILRSKERAMKEKIAASYRNYEAGNESLDTVLLAQIDRLSILAQLSAAKERRIFLSAEINSHIIGAYGGRPE